MAILNSNQGNNLQMSRTDTYCLQSFFYASTCVSEERGNYIKVHSAQHVA